MLKFIIYIQLWLSLCFAFKQHLPKNNFVGTCHMTESSEDLPGSISVYSSSTVNARYGVKYVDSIRIDSPDYDDVYPDNDMLYQSGFSSRRFKFRDNHVYSGDLETIMSFNLTVRGFYCIFILAPTDKILDVEVEITNSFGKLMYEDYREFQKMKYIIGISIALCTYLYTKSTSFASKAVLKYGFGLYASSVIFNLMTLSQLNRYDGDYMERISTNLELQDVIETLKLFFHLKLALGYGLTSTNFEISLVLIISLLISTFGYTVSLSLKILIFNQNIFTLDYWTPVTIYTYFRTRKRMEDMKRVAILDRAMSAMLFLPLVIVWCVKGINFALLMSGLQRLGKTYHTELLLDIPNSSPIWYPATWSEVPELVSLVFMFYVYNGAENARPSEVEKQQG